MTDHLTQNAREALVLTTAERIARIRNPRWIGYGRAQEISSCLDQLLFYPKMHRMPNLLLVGSTDNGKTMIVNRFTKRHQAHDNPERDGITVPVLYVQAPPVPDESRFYNIILEKLFAPFKERDPASRKQIQVIRILSKINLKMLIIDEIHSILAGHIEKQRQFLNVLKFMGNELQIPIVGVGTKDAFRALQTDPQLANRFEPMALPKWQMNEEYLRLLASFERMLPLKEPSNLKDVSIANKILSMTDGTIGKISKLLNNAAIHAINTGDEKVTLKILNSLSSLQPSERQREVERLI